jgi:hypothetical protein
MSSMSFGETRDRMLVGWETNNQIRFTALEKGVLTDPNVLSPDQAPKMKHPVFASSPEGQVLLVWTEGTGWKKGGTIAWKKWDDSKDGMGKVHRSNAEVPVWSFLAAYYDQHDDTFYVLH